MGAAEDALRTTTPQSLLGVPQREELFNDVITNRIRPQASYNTNPHDRRTMQLNHQTSALTTAARRPRMIVAAAAVAALAATIFALHPPATHAAQSKGAVVSTAKTSLGRIIVNSNGRTLYLFGKDRNGQSACSGQCAVFWPPLITSGKPSVSGGARASLIGTTRRADGRLQVTYNHHPLYTFVKDTKAGQTNGEGVNAFGAVWDAVSPTGAKILKPSAPSPGGGGGY
jgi:predicted lipoprotein with Yx(FWY)xxD motif